MSVVTKRTCAITGASSGIGLACAVTFARAGYHVAICGRHTARLESAKSHIQQAAGEQTNVVTCTVDLTGPLGGQQFVDCALANLGHLDVLVNNAGIAPNAALDQFRQEVFDQTYALNIRAVYQTVRTAWESMKQHGGATIVNISSRAAVDPLPGFSVYGASKAWVDLFTRVIADEGRPHNIAVFSVRPGAVDTPLLRDLFPDFPSDQLLLPGEVAELVMRLADPAMRHATGEAIGIRKA